MSSGLHPTTTGSMGLGPTAGSGSGHYFFLDAQGQGQGQSQGQCQEQVRGQDQDSPDQDQFASLAAPHGFGPDASGAAGDRPASGSSTRAATPMRLLNTRLRRPTQDLGQPAEFRDASPQPEESMRRYHDFSTIDWMHQLRRGRRSAAAKHAHAAAAAAAAAGTNASQAVPEGTALGDARNQAAADSHGHLSDWAYLQTWGAVTITGLVLGAIAAWLDITIEWVGDLKFGMCSTYPYLNRKKCCWENWDDYGSCDDWHDWSFKLIGVRNVWLINLIFYLGFATLFAAAAATLVVRYAPEHGALSRIPEIKTILGGFIMGTVLSVRTGLTKTLGLVFSLGSGLTIGNKAPMIHIGACIGQQVARLFPNIRDDVVATNYLLTCACAAGMAVAFGSPIAGILYALEDLSTFFPVEVIIMSLFCCIMATLTLQAFDPFKTGSMVLFQVLYKREWHLFELIPFALLAATGGLIGAMFNRWNVRINMARKRSVFCMEHPIREASLLAFVTAFASYLIPYSRGHMLSLLGGLFHECSQENYMGMCNESRFWVAILLIIVAALKFLSSVVTYGCQVPSGVFIPAMVTGACIGRVFGMFTSALQRNFPNWPIFASCLTTDRICVTPGSYALLGAASVLTGVTRLTITIVVMMFELTGVLNFILPTILTVVVSKFVGDVVSGKNGFSDLCIQMNEYPFLETKEDYHFVACISDIMTPADRLVVLQNGMSVAEIRDRMDSVPFNTFPIVDNMLSMGLEGCITRDDLNYAFDLLGRRSDPTQRVFFHAPVPSVSGAAPAGILDARAFTDQTPLALPPRTNLSVAHQLFTKVGVRYLFATQAPTTAGGGGTGGQLAGLVTKKDMVAHANAALGALAGIARHRRRAPALDPLIDREVRQRYLRARHAAARAWRARTSFGSGGSPGASSEPITPANPLSPVPPPAPSGFNR